MIVEKIRKKSNAQLFEFSDKDDETELPKQETLLGFQFYSD